MRITAIVGSYHKDGIIHAAVDEILAAAAGQGAQVGKIDLLDYGVEFCRNCQACAQAEGSARGTCAIHDDMPAILDAIDASDAIVLASPMNFWSVTAIMKRFIERLICYGYWPWKMRTPKNRVTRLDKRAVVVITCAAPVILARFLTNMHKLLKSVARLLGARKVDILYIGLARHTPTSKLSDRARAKAQRLGRKLVC